MPDTALLAVCAVLLLFTYLQLRAIATAINALVGALTLMAIGDEWSDAA